MPEALPTEIHSIVEMKANYYLPTTDNLYLQAIESNNLDTAQWPVDQAGKDMREGGGTLFVEGDHKTFEAMGHCAAYHMNGKDIFICHGYSVPLKGASILVQKEIRWTKDEWPVLSDK